jgi:hypothetical protein
MTRILEALGRDEQRAFALRTLRRVPVQASAPAFQVVIVPSSVSLKIVAWKTDDGRAEESVAPCSRSPLSRPSCSAWRSSPGWLGDPRVEA